MNHLPVAVGLVLCEQVIVDEKTRNLTPVNCFGRLKVEAFPTAVHFYVVAWLADGFGEMPVEIRVNRLDTNDEVLRLERILQFSGTIDYRFTAQIRDCLFPVAGYYEMLLIVDGEMIAHRRLFLTS